MRRFSSIGILVGLVILITVPAMAQSQQEQEEQEEQQEQQEQQDRQKLGLPRPQKGMRPDRPLDHQALVDLRRRLMELDRFLSLGSISRAESLLEELAQHRALQRELVPRRIKLAQLTGDDEEAIRLCQEALAEQTRNPGMWRSLAQSQLAVGQPDSALVSIGRFIAFNPNARSATMVGVDLLQSAGQQQMAVTLIDSMRVILTEPRLLGRQRAVGLLSLDRQAEAADEVTAELRSNPFNIALLRTDLLDGPYSGKDQKKFLDRLRENSRDPGAQGA